VRGQRQRGSAPPGARTEFSYLVGGRAHSAMLEDDCRDSLGSAARRPEAVCPDDQEVAGRCEEGRPRSGAKQQQRKRPPHRPPDLTQSMR
jgi:hypothetical protein